MPPEIGRTCLNVKPIYLKGIESRERLETLTPDMYYNIICEVKNMKNVIIIDIIFFCGSNGDSFVIIVDLLEQIQ